MPLSPFTSVLLTGPGQPMRTTQVDSAGRPPAKRRRQERSAPAVASRGDGRRGRGGLHRTTERAHALLAARLATIHPFAQLAEAKNPLASDTSAMGLSRS